MRILLFSLILVLGFGCSEVSNKRPEPHLELGQRVNFVGDDSRREYVIVGYRHLYEDKTEKKWNNQDYVVIVYSSSEGDLREGVIHRNMIQKK